MATHVPCWWIGLAVGGLAFAVQLQGDEPAAKLGKPGKQLLHEKFDAPEVVKEWTHTVGAVDVKDRALVLAERPADNHACAVRRKVPLKDAAVTFDFVLEGAKMLHFGYDPVAGELKKKGHLFSVVITPTKWSIIEHNDKSDPNSKTKVHAQSARNFEDGKKYTLRVECKGTEVVATVDGGDELRATAPDFAVQKPGLVFRVGGEEGATVKIDNVTVWELE